MLVELLGFDPEDLESRPMGSNGEDIIMGVQSENNSLLNRVQKPRIS